MPAQAVKPGMPSTPSEVVSALREGARWLAGSQEPDGDWPSPLAAGVFFRTALLDYRLYRRIFPVQALALYERWRARRGETARRPYKRIIDVEKGDPFL